MDQTNRLLSFFFLFFFIDLSSSLNAFLFPLWFFPLFSYSPIPSGFFPSLLLPPVPSFHPKRKGFFLVNLSSWNKKKITPLIAPPTHPLKNSGVCRDSPLIFFLLFFGATQPLRIFSPFFHGGITFMGFTS